MTRLPPLFRLAAPIAVLSLAGCVGAPDLGQRPTPVAPQGVAAQRSLPETASAWPGDGWWQSIGDPQLDALIDEGLAHSPDVAAAAARLRQANGMAREAGAALLPRVDVQGGVSAQKQSYNMGFPKEFVPKGWLDYGQVAGDVSFDIDLWGRNRAALAAATSEARAAAIDAQQARLMLSTGIALAYLDLDRLYAERDVAQATLDARIATQKLVSGRLLNGLETRGSVRQSEAEVATARSQLGGAEQAMTVRRHQIATLVGAGPDRGLDITRPALGSAAAVDLPAGVTTDLIGRRPDIAAARERLEAEASRIDVAHADFFPAIRLSALVGLQSLGLGNLIEKDSVYGSAGPAISLPIFHGGELKGRYTTARGRYDEAVATYDKTVLTAYQEVADAVSSRRQVSERLRDVRAALSASQEAYTIAGLRYDGGLSNYLDVLAVEDRLLQARLAVAALDAEARSLDVTLIRALGGGFTARAADIAKDHPHG
jgi:NodT family efflux transporter outer membrane factor (OMF) lipoprotein